MGVYEWMYFGMEEYKDTNDHYNNNNNDNSITNNNATMSDISDVESTTNNANSNTNDSQGGRNSRNRENCKNDRNHRINAIMVDYALKGRGIITHVNELMYENERYKQGLQGMGMNMGMNMVEGIEDDVWWDEDDEDGEQVHAEEIKESAEMKEKGETKQDEREQRQRQLYALTRCQSSITSTTPSSWKQHQDKMAVYGALTLRTEMPMMAAIQPHGHTLGNLSTGMERSCSSSSMGDKEHQQTPSRSRTRTRTYTITDVNTSASAGAGAVSGSGSSSLSRSVSMTPSMPHDAYHGNNGSPAIPKPKWRVMPMSRTALALVDKAMLVRVNNKYVMAVEVKEQQQPIEMAPVQFIGPRCRSLPTNAMKAGDGVLMPSVLDLSMVKKIGAGF